MTLSDKEMIKAITRDVPRIVKQIHDHQANKKGLQDHMLMLHFAVCFADYVLHFRPEGAQMRADFMEHYTNYTASMIKATSGDKTTRKEKPPNYDDYGFRSN